MEELNKTIANNIIKFRKQAGLTQLKLSELLNYSDKSVSKWERGDGVPDIAVLLQLCDIFHITLNDLCYLSTPVTNTAKIPVKPMRKAITIGLLSCGLAWLVSVSAYAVLSMLNVGISNLWLSFIFALPVNFILLLIFNMLWGKPILNLVYTSGIIWTVALSLALALPVSNSYNFYFIAIPLQIIAFIWFLRKK